FWKRFNFAGAVAGILVGAIVDICWLAFLGSTGIYEIIPGFAASLIAAILVSKLTKAPGKEVEELFDKAVAYED
ncbi:MAG: sodium:proline symporter, partial [Oscillospiraceae bacterium]|nr:sodium:proline symporter [Oscillospiraceae bacterium]